MIYTPLPFPAKKIISVTDVHGPFFPCPYGAMNASVTWGANNRIIYVPMRLSGLVVARRMWWLNNGTTGNIVAGLYTVDGTKLTDTGSVARSGASAIQGAALSPVVSLRDGLYYFALLLSTTGTLYGVAGNAANFDIRFFGTASQDPGSTALPATATMVSALDQIMPIFGLSQDTSLP